MTTTPDMRTVDAPTDAAIEQVAAHPDNPRRQLGDLSERSGFHLMRGSRSAVIRPDPGWLMTCAPGLGGHCSGAGNLRMIQAAAADAGYSHQMRGDVGGGPGAAAMHLVAGVGLLHPDVQVFEAMLAGWATQQRSRYLAEVTVTQRLQMLRRFQRFTNAYPWQWSPQDVEEWTTTAIAERGLAHSTVRFNHVTLRLFLDYLVDPAYGWASECECRFGAAPTQVCHEWNTVAHLADYEGRPGNRPLTREELQAFFDFADSEVAGIRGRGRKGWLPAFRDATLFKVLFAWGLRRREGAWLERADLRPNPKAPEFGEVGMVRVRWGKASRGSAPKRRSVLTVFDWAAETLEHYLVEVRPRFGAAHDGLWPTERGGRVSLPSIDERFGRYRDALGLPSELGPHCLRHSYATYLIEDGWDALFVQRQLGHSWASTTAVYTGLSGEYQNRMLRDVLDRRLQTVEGKEA